MLNFRDFSFFLLLKKDTIGIILYNMEDDSMKIAVIMTGGTIGSRLETDGWIAPNREQPFALIEKYKEEYGTVTETVEFDCEMPYQILSENLGADHLMQLVDAVRTQLEKERYDSLIVCHGTDTLQYSAAILSLLFAENETPVFLVSSNYPIEDERANGLVNFHYAVVSSEKKRKGVYVVYRNADGNTYIHKGDRLLAHHAYEDDLHSVGNEYIGRFTPTGVWEERKPGETEKQRQPLALKQGYCGLSEDSAAILWLKVYPGMVYPHLNEQVKAVLLETYHSGTVRVTDGWDTFIEEKEKWKIPVYLVGAQSAEEGYETMQAYQRCGIQVLPNQAPIAAYCWLWLQLSAVNATEQTMNKTEGQDI